MKATIEAVKFVLIRSFKATKGVFAVFLLVSFILSLTTILNIFIFKELIDAANNHRTFLNLSIFSIVIFRLLIEILSKVISRYQEYIWFDFDIKQLFYNYTDYIKKLSTFDIASFENSATYDLIWRAFNRFQWHVKYYLDVTVKFFSKIVELSASVIIFALASPLGAIFILATNIFPIFIRSFLGNQNFNIYKSDSETVRKYEYLQSMIVNRENLIELKQFQGFRFLKNRLFTLYSVFTGKQMRQYKKQWIWLTLADLLPVFAIFFFLLNIVSKLQSGQITTGTFVFLFTNIFIFSSALSQLSGFLGNLFSDSHFILEADSFFKVKQNIIYPRLSNEELEKLRRKLNHPTIELKNLCFTYPNADKAVLKNINLTISYGENVALIGENGAGKSTLVKLLLRVYDPTEGSITINGIDIKNIPEVLLFQMFSTLFQSFGKFYLTIRENLELAAGEKLTDDEYIKALKMSNAWNYVKDFPTQLNQQLGPTYKNGVDLSGGQWQQLGIARAIIRKTPILILDEPTSAIDAKAETEIFDRINVETKGNTLIFISHRFSTIKDAERIVVLDKGQISEDGSHAELMRNNKKYAKLYTLQAERYSRS